jgi:FkbM family methyltransferase
MAQTADGVTRQPGPLRRLRRFWRDARTVGVGRAWQLHRGPAPIACATPHVLHPLWLRPRTSDLAVFRQIFKKKEYAPMGDLADVRVVVDLGANVGYAAAWFLSRYPGCRLVAVEPDPDNFAALQRNLAPYGDRAVCVRAGVWSHSCHLRISDAPYRDNLEWSRQVVECAAGDPGALRGVGLRELLDEHGIDRVSLLKCDIEGAEVALFGPTCRGWLDRVDAIAIELHADSMFGDGFAVFHAAMHGQPFALSTSGEFTLCRRPSSAAVAAPR